MFKAYDEEIQKILNSESKKSDFNEIVKTHEIMIARIQHERLIHLIVTVFVGIVMTLSFLTTIAFQAIILLFLDIPLLFLFFGYLIHYRFLENTTQKWYLFEDNLKGKKNL